MTLKLQPYSPVTYPKIVWMPKPWFTYSMVSQVVH